MRKKYGLLTERQLEILRLRREGLNYKAIAKKLKTTPENIMILEKRFLILTIAKLVRGSQVNGNYLKVL